ncbi:hypothetical protein [Domibacillus robiginosus]|uniref:hypothetical protein n=1 Tax=Domibacillus robiginosus TaxID=1071054 RepID=UPI00067E4067|nr:hypothetical protein [Domibacillus robiginosus]
MSQQPLVQNVQQQDSKIAIQTKLDLLSNSYQPMIDKFHKVQGTQDWEKFIFKLYMSNPCKLTLNTFKQNNIIKALHGFVALLILIVMGTLADKFSSYLANWDLFQNDLFQAIITNNGSSKFGEVLDKIALAVLVTVPFYLIVYIILHCYHIKNARKNMKDWTHPMFNLGLYRHVNPNEYAQIEPFVREYFQLKQLEAYVLSNNMSDTLEIATAEVINLKKEYDELKRKSLQFNQEKQGLNEMLDVFQRNFFKIAECFLNNNFSNFELDLGLISPKYTIYKIVHGQTTANRIEPNTIPGANKIVQLSTSSPDPVSRSYYSPHAFTHFKGSNTACFKVTLKSNIIWIISYKLNPDDDNRMKFLSTDDKIISEETIISKNVYEIVKLHLNLQHKYSNLSTAVTEGGER